MLAVIRAQRGCHVGLVNDGSADDTGHVIDTLQARQTDRIQTVHLASNVGKAEAVQLGVMRAAASKQFDLIGYWDADLSTPFSQLPAMLALFETHAGCRLVLGSRLQRLGSTIDRDWSRHALGRVFATAASLVLDLPVYDSQCGAKLFDAALVDVLFGEPFTTKWLFDVELLARLRNHLGRAATLGAVVEVPLTHWREVAGSKISVGYMAAAPVGLLKIHRRNNSR